MQKEREKARIFRDMEQARREVSARRSECAARDRLDDRLIQVLQNSHVRVDRRRKQTEKGVCIRFYLTQLLVHGRVCKYYV